MTIDYLIMLSPGGVLWAKSLEQTYTLCGSSWSHDYQVSNNAVLWRCITDQVSGAGLHTLWLQLEP